MSDTVNNTVAVIDNKSLDELRDSILYTEIEESVQLNYPVKKVILTYFCRGGFVGGALIGLLVGVISVNLLVIMLAPLICGLIGILVGIIPALITGIILAKIKATDGSWYVSTVGASVSAVCVLLLVPINDLSIFKSLWPIIFLACVGAVSAVIVGRWALPKR